MIINTYGVYAKIDNSKISEVNSDAFLDDLNGWTKIDEGTGDKYQHAQNNYFPGALRDDMAVPLYKWDGKKVQPRDSGEIESDRLAIMQNSESRDPLDELKLALAELAEMITGGM